VSSDVRPLVVATYQLNSQQFNAVVALDGPDRYKHFISRVSDWQHLWGLRDRDGWVLIADSNGHAAFPVWPHPEYAAACATDLWAGNSAAPIEVHEFLEKWVAGLVAEGKNVAVFPTLKMKGVIVSADQLKDDLQHELARIE